MINLHKKLLGEAPMTYNDAVSAAIIATAVIGAGTSMYTASEQKKIAEEEAARVAKAEADRKAETERIARETRPTGETAKSAKFGKDTGSIDSADVFDTGKKITTSQLGTSGVTSGLGFSV